MMKIRTLVGLLILFGGMEVSYGGPCMSRCCRNVEKEPLFGETEPLLGEKLGRGADASINTGGEGKEEEEQEQAAETARLAKEALQAKEKAEPAKGELPGGLGIVPVSGGGGAVEELRIAFEKDEDSEGTMKEMVLRYAGGGVKPPDDLTGVLMEDRKLQPLSPEIYDHILKQVKSAYGRNTLKFFLLGGGSGEEYEKADVFFSPEAGVLSKSSTSLAVRNFENLHEARGVTKSSVAPGDFLSGINVKVRTLLYKYVDSQALDSREALDRKGAILDAITFFEYMCNRVKLMGESQPGIKMQSIVLLKKNAKGELYCIYLGVVFIEGAHYCESGVSIYFADGVVKCIMRPAAYIKSSQMAIEAEEV